MEITVLFVDDDPGLLDLSRRYLEVPGSFSIDTAESGKDALEKVRNTPYDAIVSDYKMPGMNGIELLKAIRASGITTPFIIFTGKGREEVVIEAFESGVDFYIQKGGDVKAQYTELKQKILSAVKADRHEKMLKESRERFHALIEKSGDLIRVLDRDGKIIFDTAATERVLGYPPGSTIGKSPFEYIHPDDAAYVREELLTVYEERNTGAPTRFRIRKADGTYTWVESVGQNYTGVPGLDGVVINTRFIDDRVRAEEALRQSKLEKSLILESVTDLVAFYSSPDLAVRWANRAAGDSVGVPPDMLAGRHCYEIWNLDNAPCDPCPVLNTFAEKIPHQSEKTTPDGRRWLVRAFPAIDESGMLAGVVEVTRDITQQKVAEEALQRNEERFRRIAGLITDFAYSCRKSPCGGFAIDWIAGAVEDITGYTPDEIREMTCWKYIVIDEDLPEFEKKVTGLEPGQSARSEIRIRRKNGDVVWLASYATCVADPRDPACLILYGGCRNITNRKCAEDALRESEERYRRLTENAEDLIYRYEFCPRRGFSYVSPSSTKMVGYSPQEHYADPDLGYRIVHEDDRHLLERLTSDRNGTKKTARAAVEEKRRHHDLDRAGQYPHL